VSVFAVDLELFVKRGFKMANIDIDAALQEIGGDQEVKVPFGELDVGHMYRIRQLTRTESIVHGKKIDGIRANLDIGDEAVKLFTYLPNAMKNMKDGLFNAINAAAEKKEYFGLCLYGAMGSSNIGRIHKPNEGV